VVIELPPGPLICAVIDLNQRWVADMGLPGPDTGQGGRHLVVPPDWDGDAPDGYYLARSTTYRVIGGVRSLPVGGDVQAANDRITTITIRPLHPPDGPAASWSAMSGKPMDVTLLGWETNLGYWRALHEVIDTEPHLDWYDALYGELAVLGIVRGKPFTPDARMTRILEEAARIGHGQTLVQSFADRRPDKVVWPGTQWEWAALRFENGDFEADGYLDVDAREKWFYQAIAASPAMFRRSAGAGSLYWLGLRDARGRYLYGGQAYMLTVPQPVPGKLFWSVTVYDAETRSQIQTGQDNAALRSLFELKDIDADAPVRLHFGPEPPGDAAAATRWIKTIPGKGWFVYFRIYGPERPAFDGTWQLPDFQPAQ
jgi:hypothetical protein